jgi:hypothetical protein
MKPADGPQLRDIHLPPAPGWWPLAPAWWILLAIVFVLAALVGYLFHRRRVRRRRVERIVAELDAIQARLQVDADTQAFATGVSQLLRRVARRFDAGSVSQGGAAWRERLQVLAPDVDVAPLAWLDEALYRPTTAAATAPVADAARQWLRKVLWKTPHA